MVTATKNGGFFDFGQQRVEEDVQKGLINIRTNKNVVSKKTGGGVTPTGRGGSASGLRFGGTNSFEENVTNETSNIDNRQDNRSLITTDSRNFQSSVSRVFSPTSTFVLNSPNAGVTNKKSIDTASDQRNIPSFDISPSLGGDQSPDVGQSARAGSSSLLGDPTTLVAGALIIGGGVIAYRAVRGKKKKGGNRGK